MSLFKQESTVQEILDRELPKIKELIESMFLEVNRGMGGITATSSPLAEVPLVLSLQDDCGGRYKLEGDEDEGGRIIAQLQLKLTIEADDFI